MFVNYVFGDLKTGAIIQEIPMFGVVVSDMLNRYGELGGSYQLDMTGKNNEELTSASIPGRTYLVVEVDTRPIWGGVVWTRTYQATSKTLQLYCKSFDAYPNERLIRERLEYNAVDQISIFLDLWSKMQSVSSGSLLVEPPDFVPSSVLKSLTVEPTEYKTYGQIMAQLANASNGFDWKIRVFRENNAYRRELVYGFPFLGAVATPNSLVLEYPGSIINYWATERISSSGTHIDVLGAGQGEDMIISQFVHNDLLETGWIEFDVEVPFKDVTSQSILDDLTITEGINRRPPAMVLKCEVKADLDPIFGSYNLGDNIRVVINDSRFNKLDMVKRLIGWDFRAPTDEGVARAILVFEGDDE